MIPNSRARDGERTRAYGQFDRQNS